MLSGPRVAHDAAAAGRHQSLGRRRFRARAATTVTAFALTVCSVSAAVLWQDFVEVLLAARNDPRSTSGQKAGSTRPHKTEAAASQDGVAYMATLWAAHQPPTVQTAPIHGHSTRRVPSSSGGTSG
jgi:hypothetical protein